MRPTASAVARLHLESGACVATLQHTSVSIEDGRARALLRLLDGKRDRAALRGELNTLSHEDLDRTLAGVAQLRVLVA